MDDTEALASLKEVANIAAGNAATALGKLMKQRITMAVPVARLLGVEEVSKAMGVSSQVASAGLVKIEGEVNGLCLFAFSPDDAETVTRHIAGQHTKNGFADDDQSVLREVVNITAGAAVSALSTFLGLKIRQSVPGSTTDMLGAVIDPFMAELGGTYEKVLVLQEVFTAPSQGTSLKLMMVFDPPSTATMLQKITRKAGGPDNG